jgi:mannose-6-phosphate isomerase-like protein (cupin superfamily)
VNAFGAFSLLLLTLTGAAIWWPGRRHWRRSLRIEWQALFHESAGFRADLVCVQRKRERLSPPEKQVIVQHRAMMKNLLLVGLLLSVTVSSQTEAQSPPSTGTESKSVAQIVPADSVKWTAARPGQDVSVMWGDPRAGAYGRFNRFAAGFEDRPHYHTRDLRVVVVSGTVIMRIGEGASQELGAGSFILMPGGTAHTHSCKTGAPCVMFVQQDGPNDSVTVSK